MGEPFVYIWYCVFGNGYGCAFVFFVDITFEVAD
jgi:hypothetical protein